MSGTCSKVLAEEHGIVLDYFHASKVPQGSHFFLSHFHTDHTSGLNAQWDKATIHVTSLTYDCMVAKYGSDAPVLNRCKVWEYRTWSTVAIKKENVEVACVSAGHCSGSAMWLFRLPSGSTVVYTGDFRPYPGLYEWSGWKLMTPVSLLLFDSSYYNPKVRMPSIEQSLSALEQVWNQSGSKQVAILTNTSGVEQLIGHWCQQKGHVWYVDPTLRHAQDLVLGLKEIAPKRQVTRRKHADVLMVSNQFQKEHPEAYVYIRPSTNWFICHGNLLERRQEYDRALPIPDDTHTFRVYYSVHASFEEVQTLFKKLQPKMVQECVTPIMPVRCQKGTALPQWDYYRQFHDGSLKGKLWSYHDSS